MPPERERRERALLHSRLFSTAYLMEVTKIAYQGHLFSPLYRSFTSFSYPSSLLTFCSRQLWISFLRDKTKNIAIVTYFSKMTFSSEICPFRGHVIQKKFFLFCTWHQQYSKSIQENSMKGSTGKGSGGRRQPTRHPHLHMINPP